MNQVDEIDYRRRNDSRGYTGLHVCPCESPCKIPRSLRNQVLCSVSFRVPPACYNLTAPDVLHVVRVRTAANAVAQVGVHL
jgi:hypothetical protein